MKIIRNRFIPFKGYNAINLFGVLFVRKDGVVDDATLRHESIHARQMKELFYVFFYVLYLTEFTIKLIYYRNWKKAYRAINFEREAYQNEDNIEYLK